MVFTIVNRLSTSFRVLKCSRNILYSPKYISSTCLTHRPINESINETQAPTEEKHDSQNTEEEKYDSEIKLKILSASLPFVLEHGWSQAAISAGAETLGYPGIVHGLFPSGGAELVQHFYMTSNQQLVEKLKEDQELKRAPGDPFEITKNAVETRLRMIIPYKPKWPQALAIMSLPQNVPSALANLLTLADDICYYSGDRSVDIMWYARRMGLATIYKMTELFMLQDKSDDHQKTWLFLSHRISEATTLYGVLHQSETISNHTRETILGSMIMARNIIGLSR